MMARALSTWPQVFHSNTPRTFHPPMHGSLIVR